MRWLLAIFLLSLSCNTSRFYVVNGYESYSPNPKGFIKEYKWRVISGSSFIYFPDSIATRIKVTKNSVIELRGIDNRGLVGRDTVKLEN